VNSRSDRSVSLRRSSSASSSSLVIWRFANHLIGSAQTTRMMATASSRASSIQLERCPDSGAAGAVSFFVDRVEANSGVRPCYGLFHLYPSTAAESRRVSELPGRTLAGDAA